MKSNIFIPKRINVGYQNRSDTYTKSLAYVIYYDEKGVLRKEKSWNSWRDEKIDPQEFENVPISGFVINKKVGGYSTGWNHRQTYVRIYDPRNFEFEISVPNLLYILENTNSIKGKGLEGEFVYGWDGTDLLLIPTSSPDYEELTTYNEKMFNADIIKAKDLTVGATYLTKDNQEWIYLGKFDYWDNVRVSDGFKDEPSGWYGTRRVEKYHYELQIKEKRFYFCKPGKCEDVPEFYELKSINKKFISVVSDKCTDNYAELFEMLESSNVYYSPIDNTKDEYIPYSLEKFKAYMSSKEGGRYINHLNDEKTRHTNTWIYSGDDNLYTVGYRGSPVTIEEIYDKYNPVIYNQYLMNGKLYKGGY